MDSKSIFLILLLVLILVGLVVMFTNKKMSLEQAMKLYEEDRKAGKTRIIIHDGKTVFLNLTEKDLTQSKNILFKNIKHYKLKATGKFVLEATGKKKDEYVKINSTGSGEMNIDLSDLQKNVFDDANVKISLN